MATGLILGRRAGHARTIGFASRARPEAGELITYSGDSHLITLAPTGTGKTSSSVIPNALTHPGALIALDIKGEIYSATADARRKMGQQVHVLDLRDDGNSGSLNPLDLVTYSGTDHAVLARTFAASIIERPAFEKDPFWSDWSQSIITGGVTWMLADCPPEKRKISILFDIFHCDDVTMKIATMLDDKTVKHRAACSAFAAFLQLPDSNTRPSVQATVQSHLRLFDSDLIRRVTDTTSFDLGRLIRGRPMTLYIIVPPMRLEAYAPLLRLWLSGLIMALTLRKKQPEHRTLMLVDEAGNLGRMDALLTATTLLRSSGLTVWTYWQNPAQLSIYGPQANTLVDNAGIIQLFGVKNYRMATDLANLIGGVSPDEFMKMRPREQLLLIDGKIQRAIQARYYEDKAFTAR